MNLLSAIESAEQEGQRAENYEEQSVEFSFI